VASKQNTIAELRSEQQVLTSEIEEARQLSEQNAGIVRLRAENVEVMRLGKENEDLPRLRNQARQLRRASDEMTKLQAENARLQEVINAPHPVAGQPALPGFVSRTALMDAGTSTPEATVQTFFWAACNGNVQRLSQLTVEAIPPPENQEGEVAKAMKDFPGFSIAGREVISPDEVQLSLQSSPGSDPFPMKLKRVGGDWKLEH
jgi:hypothetical protein